jgi:hypothetical protein
MRGVKLFLALLLVSILGNAQTIVQPMGYRHYSFPYYVNIGNGVVKATDTSAYLEVGPRTGAKKGFLGPRLTNSERATIPVPKDGLWIFNKEARKFQWFDSTCACWRNIDGGSSTVRFGVSGEDDIGTADRAFDAAGFAFRINSASEIGLGGDSLALTAAGGASLYINDTIRADKIISYTTNLHSFFNEHTLVDKSWLDSLLASASTPGIDDVLAIGQSLSANRTINANSHNFWLTSASDVYLESVTGTANSWIDLTNNDLKILQENTGNPSANWIEMSTNQFELNQTGATSDFANSISMDGDNGILIDPGSGNFRVSNIPITTSPTSKKVLMQGSGGYFYQISVADLTTGTANIYNTSGKTTSNRVDSLDGKTLTFLGTGSNYPATPADTVRFKNTATIYENSLVTNRLTDIIISGNNYGSYDATNYAGSIFFRHYGAYATGCDICGKNTMALKWTQNAAWDPVTGTGGVDTLLHGQGAHNGPGDHHYYYGDFTDTYANANRLITFEHNGAAFIRIYNNPVGNFAQTLFGLSSNSPNYTAIPNWENWDVIVGGKFAVADTLHANTKVRFAGLASSANAADSMLVVNAANGMVGYRAIPSAGGSGTVTSFAFTDGHGLDGTVSNATTTPALSIITTAANKSVLYSASGDFTASMMSQESGYMLVSSSGSSTSTANASFVINSHEDNDAILDLQASGSPLFTFQDNGTLTIVDAGGDPSTPAAGFGGIYVKNDSLRFMNDAGTIFTLGTSGAGGSGTINSGVDKHAVMYSGTGTTVDDVAGAVYNTSSKILTISGQASGDVELKVIGNPSEDANLLELARFGGGTTVSWNQYGDLTVEDRVTAYKYSGNIYGGWHPSQGGFMVTPGVGYCFTNAANFNTIDASWQRKASGVIWAVDGGLGATGYSSVIMKQLIVGSGSTFATSATAAIHMYNGTAPSASITDGTLLYSEDVSASSELKVRDEAGNITTLSPHNFTGIPGGASEDMAWSFHSERDGKFITVDMTKAMRTIEQQSKDIEDLKAMVNKLAGKTYQKKKPVKLIYTGKVNNKTK